MILLLAGNYLEAEVWARGQELEDNEWICPTDISEIMKMTNFHVLVIGTAGQNVPSSYFERVYQIAKHQGRLNRS